MIVSSTEVQNNFGRYLLLAAKEAIIITKNGIAVARLTARPVEQNEVMPDKTKATAAETRLTSKHVYGGKEASYEEYLKLTRNNEPRYEYIDGEIYIMASPVTTHQHTLQELYIKFHNFFQDKDCTTMISPYDISLKRFEGDKNVVQPDLMVICDLKEHLDARDYYLGIPTLVVEIISRNTFTKDLVKKLDLYLKCGVKEYWIVNPYKQEVFTYLFKDKEIADLITYRLAETVTSFIFQDLKLKLAEIF